MAKTKSKTKGKARVKAGTSKAAAKHRKALFVEAYCANGGNAAQAAIAAGYAKSDARSRGLRLLKQAHISLQIKKRRAETFANAQAKTQLTADEILASLAMDLRFDPAKLYFEDGSLKKILEMDKDTRLALRGAEIDEIKIGRGESATVVGYTTKVKYPEKTAAREQGMKHFGLYEKDNKQRPDAIAELMAAIDGLGKLQPKH